MAALIYFEPSCLNLLSDELTADLRAFLPAAYFAACCMLSINCFPNLRMFVQLSDGSVTVALKIVVTVAPIKYY